MFSAAFDAAARPFDAAAMSGVYAMYDDGWRCKLTLTVDDGNAPSVLVRYVSFDRFRGAYQASASFDPDVPRLLRITVRDFNELPEQTYLGHCHAGPPAMIVGVTHWREVPFGFLARRALPIGMGEPVDRPLRPQDVAGAYTLRCPDLCADVELAVDAKGSIEGAVRPRSPGSARAGALSGAAVTGAVDPRVPHLVRLRVADVPDAVSLTLHLFSHSFSAMAGWAQLGPDRVGCSLTRYR